MPEYIEREAFRKKLAVGAEYLDEDTLLTVVNLLDCEPAADVVEVVRCKDCKRCDGFPEPDDIQPNEIGLCKINMLAVKPDGFCSYGERRDDDG